MERPHMTHVERLPQGEGRLAWSHTILIILLAVTAGLYAHWVVPEQIALATTIAAWSIVVFLVARLVIGLIGAIDTRFLNHQIAKQQLAQGRALADKAAAEACQAAREANTVITVAKPGEQVYITQIQPNTSTRPLHLSPGQVNGEAWHTEDELRRWTAYNILHRHSGRGALPAAGSDLAALPAGPVDLLAALDLAQRVLIVGPSDAGKTTLLHHIMQRRYQQSKVVVIDPHASPHKWAGHSHKVFGVGRNYEEVEWGLRELIKLMLKRYEDIGKGLAQEESHPRLSIFIDEWRAITMNLGGNAADTIKTLLTESRKAAFSVFLATHSERAKPLGLAGEYDLKDGFAVVRLVMVNSQRMATLDTGNGETPVILPGPFGQPAQIPATLPDDAADLVERDYTAELDPEDEADIHFVELVGSGLSKREAARRAYGRAYAGDLVDRGKRALGEID